MAISSSRWKAIGQSQFDWQQKALAFLRERLPDQDPYRAWTNFDFIAEDGSIYEVDLLILTPRGFYLVELKSRPGTLEGDAHTWVWTHEGHRASMRNPLLLTNTKAKKLISLLKRQKALSRMWLPFLEPIVFCSAVGLKCDLDSSLTSRVFFSDPSTPGIVRFLTTPPGPEPDYRRIDSRLARAIGQAVERAGIRPPKNGAASATMNCKSWCQNGRLTKTGERSTQASRTSGVAFTFIPSNGKHPKSIVSCCVERGA